MPRRRASAQANLDWSPDGQWLVVDGQGTIGGILSGGIFKVPKAGGRPRVVAGGQDINLVDPSWGGGG